MTTANSIILSADVLCLSDEARSVNGSRPYAASRKINPGSCQRPLVKANGTPDDNDRVEIGPTSLAFAEWRDAGLEVLDLAKMRALRLQRLAKLVGERDYGAILMFDPLNIRYASDTSNMQVWAMHNPFRACLVTADGYMIVWDFFGIGDLLTGFNPLIRETRCGAAFFYFTNGARTAIDADRFAGEIDSLLRTHCGSNRRLAVDKIMVHGLRTLERYDIDVMEGEEVTEKARSVERPDEIRAIRCALYSCELALTEMHSCSAPGMTEAEVWSILHTENIRRGGEWIETRLLSSGPRTNPWFQECGPRVMQNDDLLCVDTDLVGPYGMCADILRSWLVDDAAPTDEQKRMFAVAHEHIMVNGAQFGPGVAFRELTFGGHQLP